MNQLTITVGPELFELKTFEVWKYRAKQLFDGCGHHYRRTVCIDSKGRICATGREFMAARDGGYFPIRVYAIDPEGIPEALRFPAAHPTTVEPSTTGPAKMLNEILDAIEGV